MSDKKKRKIEGLEDVYQFGDRTDLKIPIPSQRIEDLLQIEFHNFNLNQITIDYGQLDGMLQLRTARNIVIAEFLYKCHNESTKYTLQLAYSTCGDGGYHDSSLSVCVKIFQNEMLLETFHVEIRQYEISHNDSRSNADNTLPFLTKELSDALLRHLPMIVGRFTILVEKVFAEMSNKELDLLEKSGDYNSQDFGINNAYLGTNLHGVKMQTFQEIGNFLYGFVKRDLRK